MRLLPRVRGRLPERSVDMAINRRGFLALAAGQLNPYKGPGKSKTAEVGFAEDISAEKAHAPVPVGAGSSAAFRRKCVGCLKCVDACPSGILRPSSSPSHFGRPALDFRYGWCRPECNRCAGACPAGAIRVLRNAEEKKALHTGLAVWHPERCLAANGRDVCHACERHCPVKAITLVAWEGAPADAPKVPRIDADRCIGCGACEHYCPARPKTAMSVEGRD